MHTRFVTFSKLAAVLGLCVATTMCQPDHAAAPTAGRAPHSAALGPAAGAAHIASILERSRLRHGRADMTWVADLHTRAMQRWMNAGASAHGLPPAAVCDQLVAVIRSYFVESKKGTNVPEAAVFDRSIADARGRAGCAVPLPEGRLLENLTAASADTGAAVTGAYEPYAPLIQNAITNAATADDAVAAVDAVLMSAGNIPDPDFEVLCAMAEVAASSAVWWDDYLGGYNSPLLSIFHRNFSWRAFAGADIKGALLTVGALRTIGVVHPYLIAAGLFGGAAVASGLYAYDNS